jgi:hypothetical protein
MKAFGARLVAQVAIASVALLGIGMAPASAVPAVGTNKIAGTYVVNVHWDGLTPGIVNLTLTRKHTGSTGDALHTVTWSSSGRRVTIVITFNSPARVTATYLGKVTATGFNSAAHPGTMTNSIGGSGTWYATKTA